MANEPAYWQNLRFVDRQNRLTIEHDNEDLHKLQKLIDNRDGLRLAVLGNGYPSGAAVFRELKARIEANCTDHPYKSAKQEATRMAWARSDLQNSSDPARLLSAAMRLHEGEAGFPPVPDVRSIVIKRIVVVWNQALWDNYDHERQQLQQNAQDIRGKLNSVRGTFKRGRFNGVNPFFDGFPIIDDGVAETMLFHGTDATRFIVETNIDPSRGRNKGTVEAPNYGLLGQGAYFSDQIAKSATYTLCRLCSGFKCNCTAKDGTPVLRKTLLARVLLGRIHNAPTGSVVKDREGLRQQTYQTPIRNDSHSVMASGSGVKWAAGSNEFAVRNIHQIYPEFVVYWHHPAPVQPYNDLWDNASRVAMAQRNLRRQQNQVARNASLEAMGVERMGLWINELLG